MTQLRLVYPLKVDSIKTELDSKAQTVALCFEQELPVGEIQLCLAFGGSINDKLAGLYRSKYTVRRCASKNPG